LDAQLFVFPDVFKSNKQKIIDYCLEPVIYVLTMHILTTCSLASSVCACV